MTIAPNGDGNATEESADRYPDDTDERRSTDERAHLDGVEDGCGCAEVWEHLSRQRAEQAD